VSRRPSYDPGEQLRVSPDGNGVLRVRHGGTEVATIKRSLGGGVRVEADGRRWQLESTDDGWEAVGEPPASLRHRALRSDVLTIGATAYDVGRREVKGLLELRVDKSGRKPVVVGRIVGEAGADAHATIALATAAIVLDADLGISAAHAAINGDNISAALRYGLDVP
jgi:hypothetical protein